MTRRILSLALVAVLITALVLSVIIPALEMQHVMRLLREIADAIGPARALSWKLDQVAEREKQSLIVNAVLVIVALVAIGAVLYLAARERLLTARLERRVEQDAAMAEVAEALAGAFTFDEVTRQIEQSPVDGPQLEHLAALAHEKVRLIDEAREGRLELERVMKSRQRLIRGFSHDVKNPLGAADGYASLLNDGIYGQLDSAQQETVTRVRQSIRRALNLIDDLHELGRAETGNIAFHLAPTDIRELALASADEYRGAASAAGLPLTVDAAENIPLVETDGARVSQIVGNLISNAIKYTPTGAVTLRVRPYSAVTSGNVQKWVDIEITDTGPGIPAGKREQIFEEFSRLSTSDRPGAGLGLAISKRIAEALGGQIIVESEPGDGSTFTLRIPVDAPDRPRAGVRA